MSSTLKTLLGILGIVAIIMVVILVRGNASSQSQEGLITTTAAGDEIEAGELTAETATNQRTDQLVVLLRNVTRIKLDGAVFDNPAFDALDNISQTIQKDPNPGRINPFLPIGFNAPTTAPTTTQIASPQGAGGATGDAFSIVEINSGDASSDGPSPLDIFFESTSTDPIDDGFTIEDEGFSNNPFGL